MMTDYLGLSLLICLFIGSSSVMSKSCEILENLSCQCHTSFGGDSEQLICNNLNNPINGQLKLSNETLQMARSFDSFHLTFYDQELNISAMFINDLSYLFPRSLPSTNVNRGKSKATIKVTISFPTFLQLHFEDYAFYQLFPDQSDFLTTLTLELTSNGQVTFSSMAFNHLKVDQMIVHCSSVEPYSFEEIFNGTQIGELTLEGFTPRSNETLKTHFNGKIQKSKFTKMVETISSEEFPHYPVRSMTIEAHEARRMNASTFLHYRNLNGVHLIRPKFFFDNRSFDGFQYLAALETIEIDGETIKDHSFQHVSRIQTLILGSNIRYLSEHSLDHLNYLRHFDASKLTLDQLFPSARCVLARYISKQHKANPSMIINPPQAEYCDCIHDFILATLNMKADQFYTNLCENNQQERCQLNECDVVKNFRLPLANKENADVLPPIEETLIDVPIPFEPSEDQQATTHRLPAYVHRHPLPIQTIDANQSSHSDVQISHVSAWKVKEPIDPNAIPTDDYDDTEASESDLNNDKTSADDERYRLALRKETMKWLALSLVCITILAILAVVTVIWFFVCRPKKRYDKKGFQPVIAEGSRV